MAGIVPTTKGQAVWWESRGAKRTDDTQREGWLASEEGTSSSLQGRALWEGFLQALLLWVSCPAALLLHV